MIEEIEVIGQMSLFDPDTWYGKMYREPLVQTKERTLESSLKKQRKSQTKTPLFLDLRGGGSGHLPGASWVMGGLLLGEYMTHSFGEYPREERESLLSQILEASPLPKYSLSAKACQGILNRAEKRNKELPPILKQALIRQSMMSESVQTVQKIGERIATKPTDAETLTRGGQTRTVTTEALQSSNTSDGDIAETLDASYYKGCGERQGKERTVVYGISAYESNSMKSDNPHSGIYEAETTRTLDNNGGNPACNQGGMIVLEGNGTRESHKGDGYKESETMFTLNTVERHAVCVGNGQMANMSMKPIANSLDTMHDQQAVMTYGIDRASFNQGKKAQYDFSVQEEVAQTIVAKGPGGGC